MNQKQGFFVVSLDFELFWGMIGAVSTQEYGERIRGERSAIPRMLSLFKKYGIHATWGTVGMLMAKNKTELIKLLPEVKNRPHYTNTETSSYAHLETAPIDETDIHYFGNDLMTKILETPFQEIGNHTFAHLYCLDETIDIRSCFSADMHAFTKIADMRGVHAASLIFPRNQYNDVVLATAKEFGIRAYRGTEEHFLYRTRTSNEQSRVIRALRLIDHYINISGHHTYLPPSKDTHQLPFNIPSSRFFRPWNRFLRFFEPLRIRRIKRAMTHAAMHGEIFHLWWHPHNVAIDQEENFKNLEEILKHFSLLQEKYSMKSASMGDIVKCIDESIPSVASGA